MTPSRSLLAAVLWLALLVQHAWALEVIVHAGVNESELSVAQARALFAMRQPRWADGRPVRVFVLPDAHPLHAALCKEALSLYPYQLRLTWDRQVYSGIGQAPTLVASEEEMLARVAATPGAIGYVQKINTKEAVRALPIR